MKIKKGGLNFKKSGKKGGKHTGFDTTEYDKHIHDPSF